MNQRIISLAALVLGLVACSADPKSATIEFSGDHLRLVAENPGDLADAETGAIGGVEINEGLVIVTDAGDPSFWISTDEGKDSAAWIALAAAFPETGLWPLHLESLAFGDEEGRPWRTAELAPEPVSAEEVLDILSTWSSSGPGSELAPSTEGQSTAALAPSALATDEAALGLVPVSRPADVVAQLGWWGPANYDQAPGEMSAVLRSWEDRFGAYVTRLGFADMYISVTRPPTELSDAQALAVEHFAWCPTLGEFGVAIDAYAAELMEVTEWYCWWD